MFINWLSTYDVPGTILGTSVAEQNLPLPQISLCHADYFELKTIKAQKTQEETLIFSLTAWKNLDRGPVPGIELSPGISAKNMGQVWWGELSRA